MPPRVHRRQARAERGLRVEHSAGSDDAASSSPAVADPATATAVSGIRTAPLRCPNGLKPGPRSAAVRTTATKRTWSAPSNAACTGTDSSPAAVSTHRAGSRRPSR